jgi:single-strand DNA-binding protein
MSQGGYVTLIGFVAREPSLRTTKDGRQVADVRVGATTRIHDKATDEWRDGETCYYTVNCWRRLAGHVRASLRKGDPVMVKGRFRTHTYEDKQNRIRTEVEIVADTIGHDLSRGVANYMRADRAETRDTDDMADTDRAPADAGAANPDDPSMEGAMAGMNAAPFSDFGRVSEMNRQRAVDDLNRELDKGFPGGGEQTGPDQPVAGGLEAQRTAEPAPEESREPAGASVPF